MFFNQLIYNDLWGFQVTGPLRGIYRMSLRVNTMAWGSSGGRLIRPFTVSAAVAIVTAISMPTLGKPAGDQAPEQLAAPKVDSAHAQRVYHQIEQWVKAGNAPRKNQPEPIPVTGMAGVRVTLRRLGRVLAYGQRTFEQAGFSPTGPADLAEAAVTATDAALSTLKQHLRRQLPSDQRNNSVLADQYELIARMLVVDLQIARQPEPVVISHRAKTTSLYRSFASGYHGIRLSKTDANRAEHASWSWPATNLAANFAPGDQISQMLNRLGFTHKQDVALIARPTGPRLERFEVIHLTRPRSGDPITQLVRGGIIVPLGAVGPPTRNDMMRRIAAHLRKRQGVDGSFRSEYEPTAGQFSRRGTSPTETALVAYALIRYNQIKHVEPVQDQATRTAAERAARHLIKIVLDNGQKLQPAATALLLLTLFEAPQIAPGKTTRKTLSDRLLTLRDEEGIFRRAPDAKARPLDEFDHAIILAALSLVYEANRDKQLGKQITSSLDQVWRRIGARPIIGAMPWLVDADLRMHRLTPGRDAEADDRHRERLARTAATIKRLRRHQITRLPQLGPDDVRGGFDLSESPGQGAPQPDWRSAQALHLLATALRRADLLDNFNQLTLTSDCGLAVRFLAQLMFDHNDAFYVGNPDAVIGGVRRRLDDNRLTLTPAATTLLAMVELHHSLSRLEQVEQSH